jgi:hypothetical protein
MYPGFNSNSNSNPYFEYYLNQAIFTTCKGTSKFCIQVSQSKFIFMKILWGKNLKEFMRFFPKGLNSFKIQTRFKLDLLMNFIFQDSERFGSWAKKEICSIWNCLQAFGKFCTSVRLCFVFSSLKTFGK